MSWDDIVRKDYGSLRLGSDATIRSGQPYKVTKASSPCIVINDSGNWMKFDSIKNAAHAISTTPSDVQRCCRRNRDKVKGGSDYTANRWRCYFIDDPQWKSKIVKQDG